MADHRFGPDLAQCVGDAKAFSKTDVAAHDHIAVDVSSGSRVRVLSAGLPESGIGHGQKKGVVLPD